MNEQNQQLITPVSENEINEIRQLTGEAQMAVEGTRLPFIKFNGKYGEQTSGHFLKSTGERGPDGKTIYKDLGNSIDGVIIRIRKICQTGMNASRNLYTMEFDSYQEAIDLYEVGQRQPIMSGNYYDLTNQFPELKLGNVVYFFYLPEKKVYKMRVTGGSLSNLWQYLKIFSHKNDTVLRYITKFGAQEAKNDRGLPYIKMTFSTNGEVPNWKNIWQQLKTLNSIITSTVMKKAELLPQQEEVNGVNSNDVNNDDIIIVDNDISDADIPF